MNQIAQTAAIASLLASYATDPVLATIEADAAPTVKPAKVQKTSKLAARKAQKADKPAKAQKTAAIVVAPSPETASEILAVSRGNNVCWTDSTGKTMVVTAPKHGTDRATLVAKVESVVSGSELSFAAKDYTARSLARRVACPHIASEDVRPQHTTAYISGIPNEVRKSYLNLKARERVAIEDRIEFERKADKLGEAGDYEGAEVQRALAQVEIERLAAIRADLAREFGEQE